MAFELPGLAYGYEALEPHIDARTMAVHHSKHHATYVRGLNAAAAQDAALAGLSLERIVANVAPSDTALRNSGGGHWNHSFFWKAMAPPGSTNGPSSGLKAAIDASFGSLEAMQAQFNKAAAGRFGSGWAWLGVGRDGDLVVSSTANQDNPLMRNVVEIPSTPILGLDVWEHAYYLHYQNRRPEYIQAFWQVVNWDFVNESFAGVTKVRVTVRTRHPADGPDPPPPPLSPQTHHSPPPPPFPSRPPTCPLRALGVVSEAPALRATRWVRRRGCKGFFGRRS